MNFQSMICHVIRQPFHGGRERGFSIPTGHAPPREFNAFTLNTVMSSNETPAVTKTDWHFTYYQWGENWYAFLAEFEKLALLDLKK